MNEKWISVDDALPENDQSVIMCHAAYTDSCPLIGWYEYIDAPPGFYCGEISYRVVITHWMPLPKLPDIYEGLT